MNNILPREILAIIMGQSSTRGHLAASTCKGMTEIFYEDASAVARSLMDIKGEDESMEWLLKEPRGYSELPRNRVKFGEKVLIKTMIEQQMERRGQEVEWIKKVLYKAAQYGRSTIIEMLIEHVDKETLLIAAMNGQTRILRRLLREEKRKEEEMEMMLIAGAKYGHASIVR